MIFSDSNTRLTQYLRYKNQMIKEMVDTCHKMETLSLRWQHESDYSLLYYYRCLKLGAALELIRLGFRYLNMNTVATFIQASSEVFGLTILDSS